MNKIRIAEDIVYISIGIVIAILFAHFNAVGTLISLIGNTALASFIVGIFFTSLFTIAPATVLLVSLSTIGNPVEIAVFGALGAMIGDLILFRFVRDRLSGDIINFVNSGFKKSHFDYIHSKMLRWIFPLLGAVVIASPLPDELGIMLMGFSNMKIQHIIPISFLMNLIGVLLVIAASQIVI